MIAESLVGPFQSLASDRLTVERFLEVAASIRAPFAVDAAFVERVRARLRALLGAWRATRHGGALVLRWPPAAPLVEAPPE